MLDLIQSGSRDRIKAIPGNLRECFIRYSCKATLRANRNDLAGRWIETKSEQIISIPVPQLMFLRLAVHKDHSGKSRVSRLGKRDFQELYVHPSTLNSTLISAYLRAASLHWKIHQVTSTDGKQRVYPSRGGCDFIKTCSLNACDTST